jgi:hypothetical protein
MVLLAVRVVVEVGIQILVALEHLGKVMLVEMAQYKLPEVVVVLEV